MNKVKYIVKAYDYYNGKIDCQKIISKKTNKREAIEFVKMDMMMVSNSLCKEGLVVDTENFVIKQNDEIVCKWKIISK